MTASEAAIIATLQAAIDAQRKANQAKRDLLRALGTLKASHVAHGANLTP